MERSPSSSIGWRLAGRLAILAMLASGTAAQAAQAPAEIVAKLNALEAEIKAQRERLARQDALIAEQQRQLEMMKFSLENTTLSDIRGAGVAQAAPTRQPAVLSGPDLPDRPVGEAPPAPEVRAEVQAIPQEQGVLTPEGYLVFDPSLEYTRSSTNRLVFRGIELIPGIQIGLIEATDADRDTLVGTAAIRYGITNRLEVEARLPYLYRNDRIEVVQQRDEGIVRQIRLREQDFGDAEFSFRYQLNRPRPLKPIWVASLRVKSDTGIGPFDIDYDEFGVATGLATGSGFWAFQPGMNFLLPSDPVVLYGGLSYLYHMPRDINKTVGDAFIGRVDPGDAISANVGFGFALNPRFSFSWGYRHNYIFPSKTEIGDTVERSNRLQVGSMNFGMSYRFTERQTVNLGFEFGVTEDAPDVSITLRMPFGFQLVRR